jgi:predicted AAA+ superfamily ATPase
MFREVLLEWKERELPKNIIKRDVKVWFNKHIVSIIGPRRAGKTYFMFQLISELLEKGFTKDDIVYVDFTDPRAKKVEFSEFLREVNSLFNKNAYLFLDEVQEIKDWSSFIRALHNLENYKLVISGSSSKLLSREIATQLRGRSISSIVFPFSFEEILSLKNIEINEASKAKLGEVLRLLNEYLEFGGYPEIVTTEGKERKNEIGRVYYNTIFFQDIVERFKIRNVSLMNYFVGYCIANASSFLSISKVEKEMKSMGISISKRTLAQYLRYVEEALFVLPIKRFSYKYRERAKYPVKVYLIDNIYFNLEPRFSKDIGKRMENAVALSLLKKKLQNLIDEVFYFKVNDKEVDFVVKDGLAIKRLIQVTCASNKDEIEKREFMSLVKASKLLKCSDLTIITWDYKDEIKVGDKVIKCLPLWEWLICH